MADPSGEYSAGKRPRLWVPGLLYVTDAGELQVGAHAGYNGQGRAFRYGRCGRWSGVDDWTHTAWLVERAAIGRKVADEHAIIRPETLVDRDAQPHAHRWLSEQRWLCVSGLKVDRLVKAGIRVYRVSFNIKGDDTLVYTAAGGREPGFELEAPLAVLRGSRPQPDTRPALDQHSDPSPIDRVLRHLSGDALSELAVVNALQARALVEDGYGYQGNADGDFRSVEPISRDARAFDALFEAVYARAEEQRDQAKRVRQAVPRMEVEVDELELPLYGKARLVTAPPLTIDTSGSKGSARLVIDGEPQAELVIEAADRWFVDNHDEWNPALPVDLEHRLAAEERGSATTGFRLATAIVLVAVLLVLVLIGLAVR